MAFYDGDKPIDQLTDMELCLVFIDKCSDFINPLIFNHCRNRGLLPYLDYLPRNREEAKATLYARFVKKGKCFGDPEIDAIADIISRIEALERELTLLKVTEVEKRIPILQDMERKSREVLDYFKKNKNATSV